MAQVIEVPGEGPVEFPDGMSDTQIATVIRSRQQPAETPYQAATRKFMLGARAVGTGLAAPATMVGDALNTGINLATRPMGLPQLGMASGAVENLATRAGLPVPQTPTERLMYAGEKGVASSGLPIPGVQAPSLLGATSGGLAGVSGEAAQQAGLPRWAQFAASLAGGLAPSAVSRFTNYLGGGSTPLPTAADASKLAVAQEARDAGLKINPIETNRSPLNLAIGGAEGRAGTSQGLSRQNAGPATDLIAKEIGLSKHTITPAAVSRVIEEAGQKYDTLRKAGPFTADDQLVRDMAAIGQKHAESSSMFQSTKNPDIGALSQEGVNLGGASFSGNSVVEQIKQLRYLASNNLRSAEPAQMQLGKAQKEAANAIENFLARDLAKRGDLKTLAQFQAARKEIAKASLIEDAMVAGGGSHPSPRYIGQQLAKGEPLTGGLRTVGRAANEFPRDFLDLRTIADTLPASRLDVLGALGSTAAGFPLLGAAIPASKLGASAMLSSRLGQQILGTRPQAGPTPLPFSIAPNAMQYGYGQ